jgi:hypothetical protein
MRNKEFELPQTPITEETFIRQGWIKTEIGQDEVMDEESISIGSSTKTEHYYYVLSLPKDRKDEYAPVLTSNATDETAALKEAGLKSGQFFVEIMNTDGLGFSTTEEELEILYWALTGESIDE